MPKQKIRRNGRGKYVSFGENRCLIAVTSASSKTVVNAVKLGSVLLVSVV